jgi:hypothetical protein
MELLKELITDVELLYAVGAFCAGVGVLLWGISK